VTTGASGVIVRFCGCTVVVPIVVKSVSVDATTTEVESVVDWIKVAVIDKSVSVNG
jgi:hypothetical protein